MTAGACNCDGTYPHIHVPDVPDPDAPIRTFETGATRDTDANKLDFEGFLSPLVLERFAEYMDKNRKQRDGTYRDSDNWQKGIPFNAYAKSLWRHFFAFWKRHRGYAANESLEDSLCAVIFNASGYLHETLKAGAYQAEGLGGLKGVDWQQGKWVAAYDQHIGAGYPLGSDAE